MKVFNKPIATNVPLSGDYNSPYIPLKQIYTYTISAIISGTPTGTIQLQASNDPETNDTQTNVISGIAPAIGPSNWVTVTNSPFMVATSGIEMWNVFYAGYNYVRVQYLDGSSGASTATMNIMFSGKS